MRREKSIEMILSKLSQQILREKELLGKTGIKAADIAGRLNIQRSNVSHYLNHLVKEEKAIKIKGRPVYFLDRTEVEKKINRVLKSDELIINNLEEISQSIYEQEEGTNKISNNSLQFIFDSLIGYNTSLIKQIEQAKAAIMYPPNGLHTLIIGTTGAGKSLFAQKMYEFAKGMKIIKPEMDFISFNCADYSNNPQLLFSQLFGHVKGSFTGAESDRPGLVEIADGSILFLDEIHRLPPEGQETLFNLMDHGTYRRLGETKKTRKAQVRIIGATTIDPGTALLQTFLRRIPLTICIPGLDERPLIERMTFIERFFYGESEKFGIPIKVESQIIHALLLYECPWNIGQLKSDIQMICALAYVEFSSSEEKEIMISNRHTKVQLKNFTKMFFEYNDLLKVFTGEGKKWCEFNFKNMKKYPLKFYSYEKEDKFLYDSEQIMDFVHQGIYNDRANNITEKPMNYYNFLRNIVKNKKIAEEIFNEIISNRVLKITNHVFLKVRKSNDIPIDKHLSFIILSIHLHFAIKRIDLGISLNNSGLEDIQDNIPKHYSVAKTIADILFEEINKEIPEEEISYIALIISTVQGWKKGENSRVGVVVNCKGDRTNQMIKVAQNLLGTDHGIGISLPENMESNEYKRIIRNAIMDSDEGKGVLVLCENSLVKDYVHYISMENKIKVKVIYRVSTAIIVEAIRLALQPESDLSSVVNKLEKMTPEGSSLEYQNYKEKSRTNFTYTGSYVILNQIQKKVKKLME